MKPTHGLKQGQLDAIVKTIASLPTIEKAILFGSRAKGNFRSGSDIDLDIVGDNFNLDDLLLLSQKLDELNLPWNFDLLIHHQIKDADMLDHIHRVGIKIYQN